MEFEQILKALEVLLFITDRPLSASRIREIFDGRVSDEDIKIALGKLSEDLKSRNSPIEIKEVAGGYQFATRSEWSEWVKKLYKDKTRMKLSPPALETLSIVAYRQPVTRLEIEQIRGVESSGVVETLLERKLIKIVGRKESLGRPLLYGTTGEFLKYFGLKNLAELPQIDDFTPPAEAGNLFSEEQ